MTQNKNNKKHSTKKMTMAQMNSLIKFLICVNVILLIAIIILAILLARSKSESKEAIAIIKPTGDFSVCIDAGHGGSDTGAIGIDDIYEKDGNLELALKVADLLEDNGVDVVMTRDDDTYISLENRADIANDADTDLFLSIHRNYADASDACGIEAWIYSSGSDKNYAIAENILKNLEESGITQNRGVKSGTQSDSDYDYMVIRETNMTSVILEMGFISNEKDVALFDENIDDYAIAITNGIIQWLNDYCE